MYDKLSVKLKRSNNWTEYDILIITGIVTIVCLLSYKHLRQWPGHSSNYRLHVSLSVLPVSISIAS